jgi:asparagine synthase (glutamine-hydrolysing)
MYLLCQATRQDVSVAVSGDGGDELFGGYERFAAALALRRYGLVPRPVRGLLRRALEPLAPGAAARRVESAQRFTTYAELPPLEAYRSWLSFMSDAERCRALPEPNDWALRDYETLWQRSRGADLLSRLLHLNAHTYLVDDLLVKADRMSMAHGLEVRSPFLDTGLVELAFGLPSGLKVRGFERKRVLIAAVKDLLPAEILRQRKRGFAVPLDRWFRDDLRPYLHARLGAADARVRRHLRGDVIDEVLNQHVSGRRNRGQALWMLLMLELFLRRENW